MKPGLILNLHDRENNPLFEAHDPSMMKDPVSGYYYSYSTDTAITSVYRQGIPIRRSSDLITFTYVGMALSEKAVKQARDNGAYPDTEGFWAPYVEYVQGEYRMYYSATKAFGSSESKIWLAVAKHPEGPFENRGIVVDSFETTDEEPNAIDAHVIDDKSGRKYLVYGSFFGGIYIKELEKNNGMPIDNEAKNLGECIAIKPQGGAIDGPEGPAIIYNKDTDYYYLFLSYGWLGDTYDIRVGRAREVKGPYLDYHGRDLKGVSYGLKLAGSYCFTGGNPYAASGEPWTYGGFRGPGHGVPFYEYDKNAYYFVHHIRDGAKEHWDNRSYRMHYMMVRKMEFICGWPVLSPEPYAGEERIKLDREALLGKWEWIQFKDQDNGLEHSVIKELDKELPNAAAFPCFDMENSKESICLTGISEEGTAFWAKQIL